MSHIFLTGASSGIGEALALEYAAPGAKLGLVARRQQQLEAVAARCRAQGAEALVLPADVCDPSAIKAAAARFLEWAGWADLVIANAGGGRPDGPTGVNAALLSEILHLNVVAVAQTLEPFIAPMQARGRGHLAVVASLAGYRGLPVTSSYSASKSALMTWAESVRISLLGSGITVSTICPGYVRTPLTASNPFMPWLLEADEAARIIRRGLDRRKTHIAFPWQLLTVVRLARLIPDRLYARGVRSMMRQRIEKVRHEHEQGLR
jgi:short-subunit dehydrogenase